MPLSNLEKDIDIDCQAVSITILSQPLVIWKSSSSPSKYSVFADICPHRRAPLSSGKIIHRQNKSSDDKMINTTSTLACRYHGWEFDSNGSCTAIPMMTTKITGKSKSDTPITKSSGVSKAFCALSYPTKQHDGLLWVYMDPTDSDPPPLPAAFQSEGVGNCDDSSNRSGDPATTPSTTTTTWSVNVFPVSFMSMIENSFDPSHAPFTHETIHPVANNKKKNAMMFGAFSSSSAIPMEKYEVIKNLNDNGDNDAKAEDDGISRDGFVVKHTPYQQQPGQSSSSPTIEQSLTERKFVAPYTNIAQLPFGKTTLHFVPSTDGMTLVYGGGRMFAGPTNKKKSLVSKIVPSKIQSIAKDFMHFYFTNLAEGSYRFYNQDVQIMQGQDRRKMMYQGSSNNDFWDDMYPTPSDIGVKTFQTWMRRFGGRPSFVMPSKSSLDSSSSLSSPLTLLSAWDRHAKYCPHCKNTIRRLSKMSRVSNAVSSWTLRGSVLSSMLSLLLPRNNTKIIALTTAVGFLSFFATSHYIQKLVSDILGRVFATPATVPEYQLMQIYSK
jgi:phenylpropionate dioxygenase-like ring-hydroxylating dioxygenase large terminal subunit